MWWRTCTYVGLVHAERMVWSSASLTSKACSALLRLQSSQYSLDVIATVVSVLVCNYGMGVCKRETKSVWPMPAWVWRGVRSVFWFSRGGGGALYKETLNNCYEHALVTMHKIPHEWVEYVELLISPGFVTRTRLCHGRAIRGGWGH